MLKNKKIGFIGGGNMAEAIIKGMLSSSTISGSNIFVSEPNKSRQTFLISEYKIKVMKDNLDLVKKTDVLIVAVKPQIIRQVLKDVAEHITAQKLVISVAAGVPISQIEKALELYKFNELTYPTTDQGIQSLVAPPSDLKRPSLYPEGGYIKSFPQDPWGREYLYLYPGLKNSSYDVYTLGADGVEGGTGENADLGNWLK